MDPGRRREAGSARRLPRTRGDGPRPSAFLDAHLEASPHTRGWTPVRVVGAGCGPGFPAHAGMDPLTPPTSAAAGRLPRTRGDGPAGWARPAALPGASPHTRGWTPIERQVPRERVGFPAHAGMDPGRWPACSCRGGLPRTRGDGPGRGVRAGERQRASPHTRGWTRLRLRRSSVVKGFPAHAGMDPSASVRMRVARWLPRTRGDGPQVGVERRPVGVASPHTRGWTPSAQAGERPCPGFPAHAGMDPSISWSGRTAPRLPRTRGDGPA